ncbi:MAG: hypothetical protein HYS27_19985 [Deltaproteobacteria bacterium]|nr:hypothetical protein [Deltaproteobacteria bacterium]
MLALAGGLAALLIGVVLWKLFKLAFKAVVFVVVAAALAAVVALYVSGGRPAPPSVVPVPVAPR